MRRSPAWSSTGDSAYVAAGVRLRLPSWLVVSSGPASQVEDDGEANLDDLILRSRATAEGGLWRVAVGVEEKRGRCRLRRIGWQALPWLHPWRRRHDRSPCDQFSIWSMASETSAVWPSLGAGAGAQQLMPNTSAARPLAKSAPTGQVPLKLRRVPHPASPGLRDRRRCSGSADADAHRAGSQIVGATAALGTSGRADPSGSASFLRRLRPS